MPAIVGKEHLAGLPSEVQRGLMGATIEQSRSVGGGLLPDGRLDETRFGTFVTQDKYCLDMVALAKQLIDEPYSVLITGESGTGKEEIANIIGKRVARRAGEFVHQQLPFKAVNCAGVTDTLFESEMFGHKKGSFTGATADRVGHFESAGTGTLFLDEIGDLPLNQQAKLLRALQNKQVIPVGSTEPVAIKCRFITATNRNLEQMIEAGKFREDLYMRIAQVKIHLTPLRDRVDDVVLIANELIRRNKWTPLNGESIPAWAYARGNVRRLYNCLIMRELGFEWEQIREQWGN